MSTGRTDRDRVACWLLTACGVWLVGLGIYFIALRPPLLPEDPRFMGSTLEQLRQAAPDEAQYKERLVSERDKILSDARTQARHLLEDTQAHLNSRLEEQNTVQLARERARAVTAEAEQQAQRIRADADAYVAQQLNALESRLVKVLHEVQSGQRYLLQPREKGDGSR